MIINRVEPEAHKDHEYAVDGSGDRIDIREFFSIFRRRLTLMLIVAGVVFLLGAILTFVTPPSFTGTSVVMIDSRQMQLFAKPSDDAQSVTAGPSTDISSVQTQVEILKSRGLADQVATAMDLDHNPYFVSGKSGGFHPFGLLRAALSPKPAVALTPAEKAAALHAAVVDAVWANVNVQQTATTYVMSVAYTAAAPELAQAIANKYAAMYVADSLNRKIGATQNAVDLMSQRVQQLASTAAADQVALQNYKVAHNLMTTTGVGTADAGNTLNQAEIAGINQQLATAKADEAADEARLKTAQDQLSHGSIGDDVGEALDSGVVQALRAQRAAASQKVADMSGRYGPENPELLTAKRQLSDFDDQIRAEINRIISNLQAKHQVSAQRVASLQESLDEARGGLAVNNHAEAGLAVLQQKADTSKSIYDDVLGRLKGISTQQGTEQSDARLVSAAELPTSPSSPITVLWLAVSMLLGLLMGVAAVFLAEMLDAGLKTANQVEERLHLAYLGGIPTLRSVAPKAKVSPTDYILTNPLSMFAEAFRNLRASIEYSNKINPQVVTFVSALSGEGKTVSATCLAHIAAMQGARVVMVDCDLRRRALAKVIKVNPTAGLLELLAGQATLDEVLIQPATGGAYFLPLSSQVVPSRDVFGGEGMTSLVLELRSRFDLIIFDAPPLLAVSDARTLAVKSDAVVFLARWKKTPEHAVRAALRLLSGSGVSVAGVVLTQINAREQSKHGYGDPGFYLREAKHYFGAQ
jgi:succinoglycan biosynthesis transport protein ExoP